MHQLLFFRPKNISLSPSPAKVSRTVLVSCIIATAVLFTVIGILLGRYNFYSESSRKVLKVKADTSQRKNSLFQTNITELLDHARNLTSLAKLDDKDGKEVEYVVKFWEKSGLDVAIAAPYKVLLSYPDTSKPNIFTIVDANSEVIYSSSGYLEDGNALPSYFAYSPQADVWGAILYANRGSPEDFAYLISRGYQTKGCILLLRSVYQPEVIQRAKYYGVVGLLVYFDPEDFPLTSELTSLYKKSPSGSLLHNRGDPLTPFIPAEEWTHRFNYSQAALPDVPVQPINSQDAVHIFGVLDGEDSPKHWRGSLKVAYKIAPRSHDLLKINLKIANRLEFKNIANAIGMLRGDVEPDRYVIVGSSRPGKQDTEGYLGTAALLGLSHALIELKRSNGWHPGRTIVFASWSSDEFGEVGVTEWVEQNSKLLESRGVAYINIDAENIGSQAFEPMGVPLLLESVVSAAKEVILSKEVNSTMLESWSQHSGTNHSPRFTVPHQSSDVNPFIEIAGVPSVSLRIVDIQNPPEKRNKSDLTTLTSLVQLTARLVHNLSDSPILPFDPRSYSSLLEKGVKDLEEAHLDVIKNNGFDLSHLKNAVSNFSRTTNQFYETNLKGAANYGPVVSRRINDQLMGVERCFIRPEAKGLPHHVVFGGSPLQSESEKVLSYLNYLLRESEQAGSTFRGDVNLYISWIVHAVMSACRSLNTDPTDFG